MEGHSGAFSLIEVVLAIGVVAFAFVGIFGCHETVGLSPFSTILLAASSSRTAPFSATEP